MGIRELRASGVLCVQNAGCCNQCYSPVQCCISADRQSVCLGGWLIRAQAQAVVRGRPAGACQRDGGGVGGMPITLPLPM